MSGTNDPGSPRAARPKRPLDQLHEWWQARQERWLTEALRILADGRWHPNEQFPTGVLMGIRVGEKRGLLEVSNNGARLTPAGARRASGQGAALDPWALSPTRDQ